MAALKRSWGEFADLFAPEGRKGFGRVSDGDEGGPRHAPGVMSAFSRPVVVEEADDDRARAEGREAEIPGGDAQVVHEPVVELGGRLVPRFKQPQ